VALPNRQKHLRLVGAESAEAMATWRAADAVAKENAAAARNPQLQPNDPRWVLAVQTAAQLEGDQLSPEARKRIERTARLLGVRTFDANVIMAIVQDYARRKQPMTSSVQMLSMVEQRTPERDHTLTRWVFALGLAGLTALALIRWLVGA
jgi:hypothetical protein